MAMDLINNRYIQASHHIIRWLSEALKLRERIIDRLLQYYCIIDEHGKILKGGQAFAQLWELDSLDALVRKHISDLLDAESWAILSKDLEGARSASEEFPLHLIKTYHGANKELEVCRQVKQVKKAVANKQDLYILCGQTCLETAGHDLSCACHRPD